jgi:hypothetical protein
VRTFKGCIRYIWVAKPKWLILENVDLGDDDCDTANLSLILQALKDAGYAVRGVPSVVVPHNTGSRVVLFFSMSPLRLKSKRLSASRFETVPVQCRFTSNMTCHVSFRV